MQTFSYGMTPGDIIKKACLEQCPDGYPMTIRDPDEWQWIAACVNKGIDSHLEAITARSTFDHTTGKVNVHPEELHVLLRRLDEISDDDFDCIDVQTGHDPASLRQAILSTLDIEEI